MRLHTPVQKDPLVHCPDWSAGYLISAKDTDKRLGKIVQGYILQCHKMQKYLEQYIESKLK